MKSTRSITVNPTATPRVALPPAEGPIRAWMRFWFTPVEPIGLHVVRLLAGLLFLTWLLPFAGHLDSLFGLEGWFDQQAYKDMARLPEAVEQPLGWSVLYLLGSNTQALAAVYWGSVAVLALFGLGVAPRLTSVLTWLVVASFTVNPVIDYEGDALLRILAFYLMVGYVLLGQRDADLPVLSRVFGPRPAWLPGGRGPAGHPSLGAGLALRLLQVHFALVVAISGLHKLQMGEWWSGVALWFPLHGHTSLIDARAQAPHAESYLFVLSLAAYAVLVWQLAFFAFAWRPRWRPVLVGGALVGWLGTALLYRLPLLGPALFIYCLAYLTPAEWYRVLGWLTRLPGLGGLARRTIAVPDQWRVDPAGAEKSEVRINRADLGPKSESIVSKASER